MPVTTPIKRKGKIDVLEAYRLRTQHGLTHQQIADHLGVAKASVTQRLAQFSAMVHTPAEKQQFDSIRVQALTSIEEQLMSCLLQPDKLAKASLNNVAYAFQQIHTARRLEEGKATENVSVLTRLLDSAHAELHVRKGSRVPAQEAEVSAAVEAVAAPETDGAGGIGGVSDSASPPAAVVVEEKPVSVPVDGARTGRR
jgi:transcriptional regulator with XRE-family HTH domain